MSEARVEEFISDEGERGIRICAPLPTSIQMDDTETIRAYVDAHVRNAIEEWFDFNA